MQGLSGLASHLALEVAPKLRYLTEHLAERVLSHFLPKPVQPFLKALYGPG